MEYLLIMYKIIIKRGLKAKRETVIRHEFRKMMVDEEERENIQSKMFREITPFKFP